MHTDSIDGLGSWSDELERPEHAARELERLYARLAQTAPPTGRFARLWALSTLPAKLAATYGLGWVRVHFAAADEAERQRAEMHWRAALHALGTMGYLRGAVAKAGQAIAAYPNVLPPQVLDLFANLHAEAPPMHAELIAEQLRAEFDGRPERVFAELDPQACAAASIGQVQRARLLDGTQVAVKVQYPGIARAIRADIDNLRLLLLPLRLGRNWENLMAQLGEVRALVEQETDYLREALWTERARHALAEFDDCRVPRVFPQASSARVLTTEWLPGRHLADFVATHPAQEVRDRAGAALLRASFRLWCGHRMLNTDAGPGNFLFEEDGRVGLLDFGACREFDASEWELMKLGIRAQREGGRAQQECIERIAALDEGVRLSPEELRVRNAASDWVWEPLRKPGPFDFGADDYLNRGMQVFGQALRGGHTRQEPVMLWCTRQFYGLRALLWALEARVDFHAIAEAEYARVGL